MQHVVNFPLSTYCHQSFNGKSLSLKSEERMSRSNHYMSQTGSGLQVLFMHFFFKDIQQLHTKETWIVETDDESGGTTQMVTFRLI